MSLYLMGDMGRRNKREKVRRPALEQFCLIDTFGVKSEIMKKNYIYMPAGHAIFHALGKNQFSGNKSGEDDVLFISVVNRPDFLTPICRIGIQFGTHFLRWIKLILQISFNTL